MVVVKLRPLALPVVVVPPLAMVPRAPLSVAAMVVVFEEPAVVAPVVDQLTHITPPQVPLRQKPFPALRHPPLHRGHETTAKRAGDVRRIPRARRMAVAQQLPPLPPCATGAYRTRIWRTLCRLS